MTKRPRLKIQDVAGVPDYSVTTLKEKQHQLALVIPVLNENGRLTNQLIGIHKLNPSVDVIIADGGSTDHSVDVARLVEAGVTTLLTKTGSGKLSAQLRMAIHHCMEAGYEGIITMDGNGKDGIEGISSIVEALHEGYDFVQGSRFIPGGSAINTPLSRLLAIKLVHAPITTIGARFRYTDSTNGFRGHSSRFLMDPRVGPLRTVFDSYELLAYLPIQAARLGYLVVEVPVTRSYPKKGSTPTKIHGIGVHLNIARILLNASIGRYQP